MTCVSFQCKPWWHWKQFQISMVRLVRVVGKEDNKEGECLARYLRHLNDKINGKLTLTFFRRQLPLTIEPGLTMVINLFCKRRSDQSFSGYGSWRILHGLWSLLSAVWRVFSGLRKVLLLVRGKQQKYKTGGEQQTNSCWNDFSSVPWHCCLPSEPGSSSKGWTARLSDGDRYW